MVFGWLKKDRRLAPHISGPIDPHIQKTVRWVAEVISDRTEFQRRAQSAAETFDETRLPELPHYFHDESMPPLELADRFPGLGQWIAARQFAIFEILYFIGLPALPLLKRVAHGDYDWTQGNAVEILCRLAAKGVEREATIRDLRMLIPNLRYEAVIYAAEPLVQQARSNTAIAALIEDLLTVPEFGEIHAEIIERQDRGTHSQHVTVVD
ncbi:hypothetical protein [Variovorax guangxiensis]|uniref:Uncharacterized protein n=1 Tax=Variovorax guangxiensis TaxID=1775474 RepID=A0A840G2E2_9BURK|nr:hypothetical protein [Variovorax guangxiensis]MBB4225970.1 hypothetical protein [Variovorax guangxiensis]